MAVVGLPISVDRIGRVVDHWTADRPRFDPSRCTTSRHDASGCRLCADACPTAALRIDPGTRLVEIDTTACTGCDLCAAECPTGALSSRRPAPSSSVVACPRAAVVEGASIVSCAGGISSTVLAGLASEEPVVVLVGDCPACPMAPAGARAADQVDAANRILAALRLPHRVSLRAALPPPEATPAVEERQRDDSPAVSRRAFFRSMGLGARTSVAVAFAPEPTRDVLAWVDPARQPRPAAAVGLAELVARAPGVSDVDTTGLPAGSPVVDERCNGCGACAAFCPTAAFCVVESDGGSATLQLDVGACVGCGLCESICPTRALSVEPRLSPADVRAGRRTVWRGAAPSTSPTRGPLTTAAAFASRMPAPPRA
ncbi:MAG TPA: 4Fe-4S binding protein [Acidimicrobiales bacterium]|nr:4Fe-4S binding protein [Acidimicrobiales bacterium]